MISKRKTLHFLLNLPAAKFAQIRPRNFEIFARFWSRALLVPERETANCYGFGRNHLLLTFPVFAERGRF